MNKVSELAFDFVKQLVFSVVSTRIKESVGDFFKRRRIERKIEDAIAQVVEPIVGFLRNEHIGDGQRELLLRECHDALTPLLDQPDELYRGSLDGHKLFAARFPSKKRFPQAIRDERLEHVFEMLMPQMAAILCRLPAVVEDWKLEKWREDYRRLDSIAHDLGAVIAKIDTMASRGEHESERLFRRVHRTLVQRVRLQMDITGLRANEPLSGAFEAMFVEPLVISNRDFRRRFARRNTKKSVITKHTILAHRQRHRIFGPPGSGKSTWARWLELQASDTDERQLPVRIVLRSLARESRWPSWQELLRETAGPHLSEEMTTEHLRRWVDAGRVLWILDGFDEVGVDQRDLVRVWLVALSDAVDACPLVVTSRPLSTAHLDELDNPDKLDDLDEFEKRWQTGTIQEFDADRIADYIERWYQYRPRLNDEVERPVDAQALMTTWSRDPTVKPLTGNPLLLSTLLMVHHLDGELPRGRSELYRRYVDGMLGLWDKRRKVATAHVQLTDRQKRRILQKLAIHMQSNATDELDEDTASEVVDTVLDSRDHPAKAVLAALRERSGSLIGPGVYNFVHKSVAEFLVAETVVDGVEIDSAGDRLDRFLLFRARGWDRWRTILYFWAGLAPKADVEAFIGECFATRAPDDFVLAIGLMDDRIAWRDRAAIRRLLGVMCKHTVMKMPIDPRIEFCIYAAPKELWSHDIAIALANCGLTRRTSLEHALARLIESADFAWRDCSNSAGNTRTVLARAFRLAGGSKWREAVESLSKGSRVERGLCFFDLLSRLSEQWEAEDTWVMKKYELFFPELASGKTFLLIYCLIEKLRIHHRPSKQEQMDIVARIQELSSSSGQSHEPVWLHWCMESIETFHSTSFDAIERLEQLLPEFADTIDELTTEDVEQARTVLQEMKEQRAALPPAS